MILAIYNYLDNYLWHFLIFTKTLELSYDVKYFSVKYFDILQFVLNLINSENDLRFSSSNTISSNYDSVALVKSGTIGCACVMGYNNREKQKYTPKDKLFGDFNKHHSRYSDGKNEHYTSCLNYWIKSEKWSSE